MTGAQSSERRLTAAASATRVRITYLATGGTLVVSVLAYACLDLSDVGETRVEFVDDREPLSNVSDFGSARHVH